MYRLRIFFSEWKLIAKNALYHLAFFVVSLSFMLNTILNITTLENFLVTLLNPFILIGYLILVSSVLHLILNGYSTMQVYRYIAKIPTNNYLIIKSGSPGCGKSASGQYLCVILARLAEYELRFKYWLYSGLCKSKKFKLNTEKMKSYNEICDSYNYYKKQNNTVWCLGSNVPFFVNGKQVAVIDKKEIEQKSKLPFGMVIFYDEITATIPLDTYKDKPFALDCFYRLIRHFGEFHFVGSEQDESNVYINIRRVAHQNEYMLHQTWHLKPKFLICVYEMLRCILPKIFGKSPKIIVLFMKWLSRQVSSLGYRKFQSVNLGNAEHTNLVSSGVVKQKSNTYYAFSPLNFTYDDRVFKNLYDCIDMPIDLKSWQSGTIERNSDYAHTFKKY